MSSDVRLAVIGACRGSGSHSGLAFGTGCQRTLARGAADRTWGALSWDAARPALSLQPVPLSPDTGLRTCLQGPPSPTSGRHQDPRGVSGPQQHEERRDGMEGRKGPTVHPLMVHKAKLIQQREVGESAVCPHTERWCRRRKLIQRQKTGRKMVLSFFPND